MTHTPAPWLLLPNDGGVYALDENNEANRFSARIDGGHEIYWRKRGGNETSNAELAANARLIAAAPDLLEAAKLAVWIMEALPHDVESLHVEEIRAAIRKATGT